MVTTTPKIITLPDDSELAAAIRNAATEGSPLIFATGNERYTIEVSRESKDDIWANYDPEASREGILRAAGSWRDIDAEAFKAYIRERRLTKNRPSVRW